MSSISIGKVPGRMTVNLSRYGDLVGVIRSTTGSWTGAGNPEPVIELRFEPKGVTSEEDWIVWTAVIDGDTATWNEDKAACAAVLDSGAKTVRLFFVVGDYDGHWDTGRVNDVSG